MSCQDELLNEIVDKKNKNIEDTKNAFQDKNLIICFGSDLKDNVIQALMRATEASVVIINDKRTDFDT